MIEQIKELVDQSQKILIIQADNPDGDSLGSALALEGIFGELKKDTYLYCGVDMPGYLKHLSGWDRVSNELPSNFDLSFIVDASTMTLLDKMTHSGKRDLVASKPCVVLDHHGSVENEVPFATVLLNNPEASSTGELIYSVAREVGWKITADIGKFIMSAILGDTQGLTNNLAKPETYRVMAELAEIGVDRPTLEDQRREASKMPPEIFAYKARLIERTEFHANGQLALVDVPHKEIMEFSPLYNPAPLIQNDMLQTTGVGMAVVLKHYNDGKILGAIRCNLGYKIGAQLAEHFGGGGHPYASGFKLQDGRPFNEVKSECIKVATELIAKLEQEKPDETPQYTYTTN
ncbi:DHH family phosphoesterase [Candidatus Saccharibacteria bacterium]|nr:DHH family phosphoesterase [Candidatus Saccharibacteria bacterium]